MPEIQLSIWSNKLPELSDESFAHELHVVHAQEVKTAATNAGLITRYHQGMRVDEVDTSNFKIKSANLKVKAAVQLTWRSIEAMTGVFNTQHYKDTAGAHKFAVPAFVLLTAALPDNSFYGERSNEAQRVRLLVWIERHEGKDRKEWLRQWNTHAATIRALDIHSYRRFEALESIDKTKAEVIFKGTPFESARILTRGGYEEICFGSKADCAAFLADTSRLRRLEASYATFAENAAFVGIFSTAPVVSSEDNGIWQSAVGYLLDTAFTMKQRLGA